jgi:hypothetical protein
MAELRVWGFDSMENQVLRVKDIPNTEVGTRLWPCLSTAQRPWTMGHAIHDPLMTVGYWDKSYPS